MLRKTFVSFYNISNRNISKEKFPFNNSPINRIIYQTTIQTVKMSTETKAVDYNDVLSASKNHSIVIIDVREPKELQDTGKIPNSINIPLNELETALKNYSNDEFQQKFGISKPDLQRPIIFSCRSGKRANTAMEMALKLGFLNSKFYKGSWLDWEEHNKN